MKKRNSTKINPLSCSLILQCLFFLFARSAEAQVEKYYPLKEGSQFTVSWRNEMQTGSGKSAYHNVSEGRMIGTVKGMVEREGKSYRSVEWRYENIPYMTAPTTSYFRTENGNLISANEIDGKLKELIELPADLKPGSSWEYNDGADSVRVISPIGPVESPLGPLSDCFKTVRHFKKPETEKQFKSESIYCAGKGEVRWFFNQDLNGSTSNTAKELIQMTDPN